MCMLAKSGQWLPCCHREGDAPIPHTTVVETPDSEREAFRQMARHARCCLWQGTVTGLEGWEEGGAQYADKIQFVWDCAVQDVEAARQVIDVAQEAGEKFQDAWRRSRLTEDHQRMWKTAVAALQRGDAGYTQDFRCRDRYGKIQWLHETVTIIPLRHGHWRVFGVVVNVTESKALELELARSNAELEQFAYAASHDLREPLRMIASYTELLARGYKGKLDADADDLIGFTTDGVNRMTGLIDGLLAYSRLTTRKGAIVPTDIGRCFQEAKNNLKVVIEESGARIDCEPLPTLPADGVQIMQLFQNLLSNAMVYRAQRLPQISVRATEEPEQWVFAVADNGIGIEEQYFERIFVIFQRLHAREQYPGMGMGLTICKKVVQRHGGRIWVESKTGEGSTFYFSLPKAALAQ